VRGGAGGGGGGAGGGGGGGGGGGVDEWDQRRAGYRRKKDRSLYQTPLVAHLLSFSTEQQLGTG